MAWTEFALVLLLFLGTHFLPSRRAFRDGLIARVGRRTYFAAYGTVSTVLLVWLVVAAARAPYVPILDPMGWQRWVPNLVMPLAVLLLSFGIGFRYPHTLGSRRNVEFDPTRPGFAAITRHPMLWALVLWAAAHLLANPDVAHAILFGLFLGVSLLSMRLFDRRAREARPGLWPDIRRATATLSLRPLASRHFWRTNARFLGTRTLAAAALYAAIYALHGPVIGVSPLP
jgi:uncharacterized membrane protein